MIPSPAPSPQTNFQHTNLEMHGTIYVNSKIITLYYIFPQNVTLSIEDIEMVGDHNVLFYVAITANSSSGSSTMCVLHEIIGGILQ